MHHDSDDQSGADQNHAEDREAGDGRQLPDMRRLLQRFTCSGTERVTPRGKRSGSDPASSLDLNTSYGRPLVP